MTIRHVSVVDPPDQHRHHHPAIDHAVLALVRSPVHHLVDESICELRYHASRRGDHVSLPVLFADAGRDLVVLVGDADAKTWWRSFRQPRRVYVRRGDQLRTGWGRVLDPGDHGYPGAVDAYRRRHGVGPTDRDRVVLIERLVPAYPG
jgi:hypothetical protein